MLTIRNIGGVSLFLFGTTYLWLMPSFASKGLDTTGVWWDVTRVASLATLCGFSVATWGLFQKSTWWESAAIGSAVLGVLVLVPYWIAAHRSGETTPWWNVTVHAVGAAGVFVLLLIPSLERWVSGHVNAA